MKKVSLIVVMAAIFMIAMAFKIQNLTGGYAVVVNKDNPIASLSASEAKLYFTRKLKSRWPGINKTIRPVTRKSKCAERDEFYNAILKMGDSEVDKYFSEREFQNAEKQPEKLRSDAEVVSFAEGEVGAIGFVNSSKVSDAKSRFKVVFEFY